MKCSTNGTRRFATVMSLACVLAVSLSCARAAPRIAPPPAGSLWARENLLAWCATPPWDTKARGPEERAQMLARLGFKRFAFNWRENTVPTFDAEIEALQRHGIELAGWALYGADNPHTRLILETFKRHRIRPQLWVVQGPRPKAGASTSAPLTVAEGKQPSKQEQVARETQMLREDLPTTVEAQAQRVIEEADRIHALVKLTAPYGSKVALYNHNGWLGMIENQLAIIERLKELGVTDVGIVYNFSHARDALHDDSKHFPELWAKMKDYVVAVNITGMRWEGELVYPSQGDSELDMMRTIQESGWRGPIGVIAEKGGDAEVTLRNNLLGLEWLAAELARPGSGGPRPFPPVR